jgi:hypothetical protein
LPRVTAAQKSFLVASLKERLIGLYGPAAVIELSTNSPQGVVAAIEVPLATAGTHR